MKAKQPKPDQHKVFVETAKQLGCNQSEASFDKTLKELGRADAAPKAPKKKRPR